MAGYDVNSLTKYVEENKEVLIKDIVLGSDEGGNVIPMLSKQLGIKTSERLHPLKVSAELQEATSCGFTPKGSTVISERVLETGQFKVNDEYCPEDLLGKFAEYKVRVGANEGELPFEAEITNELVNSINEQMEKNIWQSRKDEGGIIDGFIYKAQTDGETIRATYAAGTSAYEAIKVALKNIPEDIIDKAVIFVSPAMFREYLQDLVAANLYHYDPANGANDEFYIPGSNVKVKKASGMKGRTEIYATAPENMVYGADMIDNKEEVKVWFSNDADLYRVKVRFNAGVQTIFPDLVVLVEKA